MATDRYSDNHKIIVGGGSGVLELDADLTVSGNISVGSLSGSLFSEENIEITSQSDVIITSGESESVSINNFDISADNTISTPESIAWDTYNWNFSNDTTFNVASGKDLSIVGSSDLEIYSTNTLTVSANSGDSPKVVINNSGTSSINISADIVSVNQSERANTTVIPASAFTILDYYDDANQPGDETKNTDLQAGDSLRHTNNGNIFFSIDTAGSGQVYVHFFAHLPDSIPDGSTITHLGCSLDRGSVANYLTVYCYVREYDFRYEDGAPGEEDLREAEAATTHESSDHIAFFTDSIYIDGVRDTMTIDRKNKAYTLKVMLRLQQGGDRNDIYFTSFKIGYTTTKLDPNI